MSLSIHFPRYQSCNPVQMRAMCGGCKLVIGRGELGQEPAAKLVLSLSGFIIITTLIHWIPAQMACLGPGQETILSRF